MVYVHGERRSVVLACANEISNRAGQVVAEFIIGPAKGGIRRLPTMTLKDQGRS
jgi:glutamate dehydrogenase/leucine dehydrogenase